MIYVIFWYLVVVTILLMVANFYTTTQSKFTSAQKVRLLFGTTFRTVVGLYFLYVVYPLLELIK